MPYPIDPFVEGGPRPRVVADRTVRDRRTTIIRRRLMTLNGAQWLVLSVVTGLMFIDGFDLVALGLVARSVREEFGMSPALIGFALSAAQLGSILSAAVAGRLSEQVSEATLLIWVAVLLMAGSVVCGGAHGISWLMAGRAITGLGLGAALPLTVGYLARMFHANIGGTIVAIALVGVSAGQIVAGLVAPSIVAAFGWRALFVGAAVLALLFLPLLFALPKAHRGTARMFGGATGGRFVGLLRSDWKWLALLLFPVVLGGALVLYFLLNWLPFLTGAVGLSPTISAACASAFSAGGLLGVLGIGLLLDRGLPPFGVLAIAYGLAAASLYGLSVLRLPPIGFLALCFLLGAFLIGSYNSVTMLIGKIFPKATHVHVVGVMTMLARAGGLIAPAVAGIVLTAGHAPRSLFLIAALLAASVAIALMLGARLPRPMRSEDCGIAARASTP